MPTKYSVEDAPIPSKYTIGDVSSGDSTTPPQEGFLESLGHTFGIGKEEAEANKQAFQQHPILSSLKTLVGGPALQAGQGLFDEFMRSTGEAGQAVDAARSGNPYAAEEHGMYAVPFVGGGIQRGVEQLGPNESINPAEMGTALGTAIQAAPAVADIARPITRPIESTITALPRKLQSGLRSTIRNVTNTTPSDVAGIVRKTSGQNVLKTERVADINARRAETDQARITAAKAANDKAIADAADANAKAAQEHAAKTQSVADANATKQADFNAAQAKVDELTKAAQDQTTKRGQLARQVQEQSARLVNRIQTIGKNAKGRVDSLYGKVREATKGQTVEPSELADAVQKAEGKIQGSSENIKVFRDILSKQPEEENPEFIETPSEGKVPRGHALYDVLLQMSKEGAEQPPPMGFSDLQGYYSELGEKLASGNLPGDVYQAIKSLQGDIGGLMQRMASAAGVGAQLKSAQGLHHDYMQTFKENTGPSKSGSPIAQSLLAKDPTYAIKPLSAEETAARVRNDLARFDPSQAGVGGAAQLYDNFRQSLRDFDKTSEPVKVPAPPKPVKLKPAPEVPEPVQPNLKPIPLTRPPLQAKIKELTPQSIEAQKASNIAEAAEKIRKSKSWVVNSLAAYDMIRSGLQGNWGHVGLDIMVRALYSAGKQGIAMALDDPRVVQKLSRLTPEDVAAINKLPPEQRTAFAQSIQPIAEEAAKRGIRISPVLAGLAGLTGTSAARSVLPPSHPLAQSQPAQ